MAKELAYAEILVAVILEKDYRYLLLQEKREQLYGLWNFPCGHVEEGEIFEEAAAREVKEKTGYAVKLNGEVKIFHKSGDLAIKHVYAGEITDGELTLPQDEIMDAQWFSFEEIESMRSQLRHAWILDSIIQYEENSKNFV